jgi:hypothetical protein
MPAAEVIAEIQDRFRNSCKNKTHDQVDLFKICGKALDWYDKHYYDDLISMGEMINIITPVYNECFGITEQEPEPESANGSPESGGELLAEPVTSEAETPPDDGAEEGADEPAAEAPAQRNNRARFTTFTRRAHPMATDVEWIIRGVIPVGVSVIYGDTEAGKSWFALQLARAIATGDPFLGQPVEQKKRVLYVAFEGNYASMMARVYAVFGGPPPATFEALCPTYAERDANAADRLAGEILSGGTDLVIADRLGNIAETGLYEYKTALTKLCNAAWDAGASAWWVEHTLKGRPRVMKGGTSVIGEADSRINILRGKHAMQGWIEISDRFHPPTLPPWRLAFGDTMGEAPWRLLGRTVERVKPMSDTQARIQAYILGHGPVAHQAEICKALDLTRDVVSKALKKLLAHPECQVEASPEGYRQKMGLAVVA